MKMEWEKRSRYFRKITTSQWKQTSFKQVKNQQITEIQGSLMLNFGGLQTAGHRNAYPSCLPELKFTLGTSGETVNFKLRTELLRNGAPLSLEINAQTPLFTTQGAIFRFVPGGGEEDGKSLCFFEKPITRDIKKDSVCWVTPLKIMEQLNDPLMNGPFQASFKFRFEVQTSPVNKVGLPSQLALDLGNLLDSEECTDVTIICKDGSFKAHRGILLARSEFFRGMFSHDTLENIHREVKFEDKSVATMKSLVRHLYTGEVPPESQITEELLIAAQMLLIQHLREVCDQKLAREFTSSDNNNVQSALDKLVFATTYDAGTTRFWVAETLVKHFGSMLAMRNSDLIKGLEDELPPEMQDFMASIEWMNL